MKNNENQTMVKRTVVYAVVRWYATNNGFCSGYYIGEPIRQGCKKLEYGAYCERRNTFPI